MASVADGSAKGSGAPTPTQHADGGGLGELLRAARERRGLTLEQVARETKIPRRHLEALEHDNLAALPGPFYQRAEIRTYARAVSLDPDVALAQLERILASSAGPITSPPTAHEAAGRPSLTHLVPVALGIALTAAVLWRVVPKRLSVEDQRGIDRVADSAPPILRASDTVAMPDDVATAPVPSEGVLPPPVSTEAVRPAVVEPGEARPTAGANGELPLAMKPGDQRVLPASVTELIVESQPAGARVTVDGIGWGVTPVTIRHLPPGSKRIRVSKDGYAAAERVVSVAEGHRNTTDIQLRNEPQHP
jgi:cytoskeleton protein RodZ